MSQPCRGDRPTLLSVHQQLFHAAFQTVDRQRVHVHDFGNVAVAFAPVAAPAGRLFRIEPDEVIVVFAEALDLVKPRPLHLAGTEVVALFHQFVHIHQRIADQNDLVLTAEVLQDPVRRHRVLAVHARVGINI